jgi:hypothetical protein
MVRLDLFCAEDPIAIAANRTSTAHNRAAAQRGMDSNVFAKDAGSVLFNASS